MPGIDNAIFDIEDYIGGNIENQETIDHMGLTVFLRNRLTHLIETEKKKARIEELKDMLESDNDPTQCVHCEILSRLSELQGKDK